MAPQIKVLKKVLGKEKNVIKKKNNWLCRKNIKKSNLWYPWDVFFLPMDKTTSSLLSEPYFLELAINHLNIILANKPLHTKRQSVFPLIIPHYTLWGYGASSLIHKAYFFILIFKQVRMNLSWDNFLYLCLCWCYTAPLIYNIPCQYVEGFQHSM